MAPRVRKLVCVTPRAGTSERPTPAPKVSRKKMTAVPTTAPAKVALQEKRWRKSAPASSEATTAVPSLTTVVTIGASPQMLRPKRLNTARCSGSNAKPPDATRVRGLRTEAQLLQAVVEATPAGRLVSSALAAIAAPPLAELLDEAVLVIGAAAAGLRSKGAVRRAFSSAVGLSECRQLPSKNAPASTANASWRMLPSTWQ